MGLWSRPLGYLERCRRLFGGEFTLRLPAQVPFVMLTDPGDLKQLFTASPEILRPGVGARILEPVFGPGSLLLLDGEEHLQQRRLMLPAFRGDHAQGLAELVDDLAERAVEGWPRERPVALQPLLQELTLSVIIRVIFGETETGSRLAQLHERVTEVCDYGNRSPLSMIPAGRVPTRFGPHARFSALRAGADELLFAEIAERRRGPGERGRDVLSMLLGARRQDGEALTDAEIRDQLMTLLVVGHETSATELAWAFELLCRAPDVVRRLIVEIDGDGDGDYLRATVNEVLRRRPVLPTASPRAVHEPIEIGGRRYEPGVNLVAAIYLVHHDAKLDPDPHAFRPERFLGVEPGTYSWIPFGGGRRRCLGSGLALLEMGSVLRAVLRRSEISPVRRSPELARRRSFAVGPARGAEVILRDRRPGAVLYEHMPAAG